MACIRQLLKVKGQRVWSVRSRTTVYEAIKKMADKDVGSLLVVDDGVLVGIITERHYARSVVLKGKTSPETLVADIMERNVLCITLDDEVDDCMELMTENCVRHLPVIEDDAVIGIVSIGDLVKCIIHDQRFVIEQLESYISGERMAH